MARTTSFEGRPQPQKGLIDKQRPAFAVVLADGGADDSSNIPAKVLSALITRNGGEVIPWLGD